MPAAIQAEVITSAAAQADFMRARMLARQPCGRNQRGIIIGYIDRLGQSGAKPDGAERGNQGVMAPGTAGVMAMRMRRRLPGSSGRRERNLAPL